MANKRPPGGDFDPPMIPLKQQHIEGSTTHVPLLVGTQQPIAFTTTRGTLSPSKSTSHISPIVTSKGAPPTFIGILPTTSPISQLEFPTQTMPTITTPSGIIPLSVTGHHLHGPQQTTVTQLAALANLSSLSQRASTAFIRPLIAQSILPSPLSSSLTTPPTIPETPPPPYSMTEMVATEEYGCSSPSQFLHSPTAVQSGSPYFTDSVTKEKTPSVHTGTGTSDDIKKQRMKLLNQRRSQMMEMKLKYERLLQEKFFLEAGGNMMDYQTWKKKPSILKDQYMKQNDLDSETSAFEELLSPRYPSQPREKIDTESMLEQESPLDFDSVTRSHTCITRGNSKDFTPSRSVTNILVTQTPTSTSSLQPITPISSVPSPSRSLTLSSPRPPLRSHSTLSVTEVSHEDIVMRARHEAEVMKAISELKKEGLWSSSRLPKVQEPAHLKTHWDYLLEEMQWLATDFANERRWKINAAKKVCNTM